MNNVSFQAKGDKTIFQKMKNMFKPKQLPREQRIIERCNGLVYGMTHDADTLKEIIIRDTKLGHSDFVKGINEALSKKAAKDAYASKNIDKLRK